MNINVFLKELAKYNSSPLTVSSGRVISIDDSPEDRSTCTIEWGGQMISGVCWLSDAYLPTEDDIVSVLVNNGDALILGASSFSRPGAYAGGYWEASAPLVNAGHNVLSLVPITALTEPNPWITTNAASYSCIVLRSGVWEVGGSVSFAPAAIGHRLFEVFSLVQGRMTIDTRLATDVTTVISASRRIRLAVDEELQFFVRQNSGGTLAVTTNELFLRFVKP